MLCDGDGERLVVSTCGVVLMGNVDEVEDLGSRVNLPTASTVCDAFVG